MKKNIKQDYKIVVNKILNSYQFKKRKKYLHHGKITVYDHSLKVSKKAYAIARKLRMKHCNCIAIGGLLHDFYDRPWQTNKEKKPFFKQHGFVHASEALKNSEKYFPDLMNDRIKNIILRHMFPLNITPPKYKEAWLVSAVDKIVSIEALFQPKFFKSLFKRRKKRRNKL